MEESGATVALVVRVARRLRELALRSSQDDAAPVPIGPAELALIEALTRADGPMTVTALARTTGLAQSWVSKLVRDLASSGAVTATKHDDDRRRTLVELAEEVRAQVFDDAAERSVDTGLTVLLPHLSSGDRERAKRLIIELDRLLDPGRD